LLDPQHLTKQYRSTKKLSSVSIRIFQKTITSYFQAHPRSMVWRETSDPYQIMVSEIMLQQTQVDRVKAKFDQFMAEFPTVQDLADAELSHVLSVWQGLGYNRRAISLKRCAEEVSTIHGGQIPASVESLESLPGIGSYTARAIAAFAFDRAEPLIETNLRAVFIYFFFHGQEQVSDREIMPLIIATLDRKNPREWYYALMDYGVMLKRKHRNPARRSNRHVKQSAFEGSNRQLRSLILRTVLESPGITLTDLLNRFGTDEDSTKRNLDAMVREGFMVENDGGYRIRK
jgi:A/G-specific adenine glycosylase